MIEVQTWQVITFFITLFVSLIGIFVGIFKSMMAQFGDKLDERFAGNEKTREQQFKGLEARFNGLEPRFDELAQKATKAKELATEANKKTHDLELKMFNDFQRREDAVRSETATTARYDAINAKLDQVILKVGIKG